VIVQLQLEATIPPQRLVSRIETSICRSLGGCPYVFPGHQWACSHRNILNVEAREWRFLGKANKESSRYCTSVPARQLPVEIKGLRVAGPTRHTIAGSSTYGINSIGCSYLLAGSASCSCDARVCICDARCCGVQGGCHVNDEGQSNLAAWVMEDQ